MVASKMATVYHLSETELSMIRSWAESIDNHYSVDYASRLHQIADKAILTKELDKDEIQELLELLPYIIPREKEAVTSQEPEIANDWHYFYDEENEKYRQKMQKLNTALVNILFLQNAVYQNRLISHNRQRSMIEKKSNEKSNQF